MSILPDSSVQILNDTTFSSTILPVNDFYGYVNQEWIDKTTIPDDYTSWGITEALHKKTSINLKNILDNLKNTPEDNLLKGYYDSYMNIKYRDQVEYEPIIPYLDAIEYSTNIYSLVTFFLINGFPNVFGLYAEADLKDSNINRPYLVQSGLGLPKKACYFDKDFEEIRKQYIKHISKMFKLINYENKSKEVFEIEKKLAEKFLSPEAERDVDITYNKVNRKQFFNKNMNNIFDELKITNTVILDDPKYFKFIEKMFETEDLKPFFVWKLLQISSSYLSQKFVDESFDFYGKKLRGVKKQKELWMRGISYVNSNVGELLSKKYVKQYFPESSKTKMLVLVKNLRMSLKEHIKNLPWMDEKTKKKALIKLKAFRFKIGYPNKFKNYKSLKVFKHPFDNNIESHKYHFQVDFIDILEKTVDKENWVMLPHTINAYFHPTLNEIVFPAAILQPPFFDPNADDALNYGSIGTVIGHEMTHGYDDQGRKFDNKGNVNDWWTENDSKIYDKMAKKIIKQYDQYELYGKHLNGNMTQGENIADLGGLKVAFTAFKNQGICYKKIDDLTADERFFISYAISWRQKVRKKEMIRRIVTDVHSPGKFRVNGVLFNSPEFQKTYNVCVGDKMYHKPVVEIW